MVMTAAPPSGLGGQQLYMKSRTHGAIAMGLVAPSFFGLDESDDRSFVSTTTALC